MKKGITFLLLVVAVISCVSQQRNKTDLEVIIEKDINRIEFSKLTFFTKELILLGVDTSFQSKFRKKLIQYDNVKWKTIGDQREYHLTLHLLYSKLIAEKSYEKEYQAGKDFLLAVLQGRSEMTFPIDENLILQQIDGGKRGLVNGYDEGTVDESSFIFFCYDPLLYKRALLKKNLTDDWERTGVFLCNYLRENGNPISIRNPIKQKILTMLNRNEIQIEFRHILKDIEECDVSSNLFD
jgi:hypothetical protein